MSTATKQPEPATEKAAAEPTPQTPPKENMWLTVTTAIDAIFDGKRSKQEELLAPTAELEPNDTVIGAVDDPISRELFSLNVSLGKKIRLLAVPRNLLFRNPETIDELNELSNLKELVGGLVWARVRAQLPVEYSRAALSLSRDWKVSVEKTDNICPVCGVDHSTEPGGKELLELLHMLRGR